MTDEACSAPESIVENFAIGHRFLKRHGFPTPHIGWQIDPFGHSNGVRDLMHSQGFDAVVLNRIDFREKRQRSENKSLETVWGSGDDGMLAHILDRHYSFPPGFDFEQDPPISSPEDLEKRCLQMIKDTLSRAKSFKSTKNFLMLAGDDFRYRDAPRQFDNWDKIMECVNGRTDLIQMQYSTVSDFFSALHLEQELSLNDQSLTRMSFPRQEQDFMPYADGDEAYWTGYFTSHPRFKRLVRLAENILYHLENTAVQYMFSRTQKHHRALVIQTSDDYLDQEDEMTVSLSATLNELRQRISEVQHHDAITGTAKLKVMNDYENHLRKIIAPALHVIRAVWSVIHSVDLSIKSEERWKGDSIGVNEAVVMMLHNSLDHPVRTFFEVPVKHPGWRVLDKRNHRLNSQVHQRFAENTVHPKASYGQKYSMFFEAEIGALSTLKLKLASSRDKAVPVQVIDSRDFPIFIENENLVLTLSYSSSRMHMSIILKHHPDIGDIQIDPFLMFYRSHTEPGQASGAYIFRTDADAFQLSHPTQVEIVDGPVVKEIRVRYDEAHSQIFRLYESATGAEDDVVDKSLKEMGVEVICQVGTIPKDSEVVVRAILHPASGDSKEVKSCQLETDSNGLFMTHRDFSKSPNIAANFFPTAAMARYTCHVHQKQKRSDQKLVMTVIPDRSVGVGSQRFGQLDVMTHRRTSHDDGRGVDEPLDDVDTITSVINIVLSVDQDAKSKLCHEKWSRDRRLQPLGIIGGLTKLEEPTLREQLEISSECFDFIHIPGWRVFSMQTLLGTANSHYTGKQYDHLLIRLQRTSVEGVKNIESRVKRVVKSIMTCSNSAHIRIARIQEMTLSGVEDISHLKSRLIWRTDEGLSGSMTSKIGELRTFRIHFAEA